VSRSESDCGSAASGAVVVIRSSIGPSERPAMARIEVLRESPTERLAQSGPSPPIRDVRPLLGGSARVHDRPMTSHQDVIDNLRLPTRDLRHAIPDVWRGRGELHDAVMVDGALSGRTKELMAMVAAMVKRCDGCVAYHARAAALRGATADEVAEALGVAHLIDGGTASVYGPRAWEVYHEFAGSAPNRPTVSG